MPKQKGESQGSTPTDTSKSPTSVEAQTAGLTVPRSPDASDRAVPVKAIHFGQVIKWPEVSGAASSIQAGAAPTTGYPKTNVAYVASIFLYRGNFVIDGRYFMPEDCSYILCFEY